MKIHHLNCMSFHFGVDSITHCLLIQMARDLVLVDTGLGIGDYENPSLKMRFFKAKDKDLSSGGFPEDKIRSEVRLLETCKPKSILP